MKELLIYIGEVSILIGASYIIYRILFSRDAIHSVKRFLLLAMIALSFTLPICRITTYRDITYRDIVVSNQSSDIHPNILLTQNTLPASSVAKSAISQIDWTEIVLAIYCLGVVIFLAYRLVGITRI